MEQRDPAEYDPTPDAAGPSYHRNNPPPALDRGEPPITARDVRRALRAAGLVPEFPPRVIPWREVDR